MLRFTRRLSRAPCLAALATAVCAWSAACSDAPSGPAPGASGGSASGGASGGSAGGESGGSTAGTPAGGTAGQGTASGGSAGAPTGGTGDGAAGAPNGGTGRTGGAGTGGSAGAPGNDRTPEGVCARWNADRTDISEGTWSGNRQSCDPGDISAEGRANALRLLNLQRWLADLPAVVTDPGRNQLAQACALMMDVNNSLSHDPPQSWTCWSEQGRQGAATSNISGGPGVMSIALYMLDRGNETTMGHRRIILGNSFGPVGLGSTGPGGASCMQNNDGTGNAGKEWVAWPPPGPFPLQAYAPGGNTNLSNTGWSVQSETIQFGSVQVTVSSAGSELPVTVSQLQGNYGRNRAIRIVPTGWTVEAGASYAVSLTGITPPISYKFQIVDCN